MLFLGAFTTKPRRHEDTKEPGSEDRLGGVGLRAFVPSCLRVFVVRVGSCSAGGCGSGAQAAPRTRGGSSMCCSWVPLPRNHEGTKTRRSPDPRSSWGRRASCLRGSCWVVLRRRLWLRRSRCASRRHEEHEEHKGTRNPKIVLAASGVGRRASGVWRRASASGVGLRAFASSWFRVGSCSAGGCGSGAHAAPRTRGGSSMCCSWAPLPRNHEGTRHEEHKGTRIRRSSAASGFVPSCLRGCHRIALCARSPFPRLRCAVRTPTSGPPPIAPRPAEVG